MKYILMFILSFVLISALPFLWNQFSFVEAGFPFPYLHITIVDHPEMNYTVFRYVKLNLVYDLALLGIFVWIITKYRTTIKTKINT